MNIVNFEKMVKSELERLQNNINNAKTETEKQFCINRHEVQSKDFDKARKSYCNSYKLFKDYQVEADTLEEFLLKYTKHKAHQGRGEEYVADRIKSHQEDINRFGFTFITHHDSITGKVVSYYPKI